MNKRVVLENDKSPSEMEAIVNKYLNDCHDQHELARRIGVHKDYIE